MEDTEYVPIDPDFLPLLDEAFARQIEIYGNNIQQMKDFEALTSEEQENAAILDEHGEPREFIPPECMEFHKEMIIESWQEARKAMLAAENSKEQAGALFQLLTQCYHHACYSGNEALGLQFFEGMIRYVGDRYVDEPALLSTQGVSANVMSLGTGRSPEVYWQTTLADLSSYAEMCLEGLYDIEMLTEALEHSNGNVGDAAAQTPYDLTLRRYCVARDLPIDSVDTIPDEDRPEFIRKMQKFYVKELLSPLAGIFPPDTLSLEHAWFLGAAIRAIQIDDTTQILKNQDADPIGTVRRIINMQAEEEAKYGNFAERILAKYKLGPTEKELIAPIDARTFGEILADKAALERIRELLQEVADDFPDMGIDPGEMVAAKEWFDNEHLSSEPVVEVLPEGHGR